MVAYVWVGIFYFNDCFYCSYEMCLKRNDNRETTVVAFGKCRWKQIKNKHGGEKCNPNKRKQLESLKNMDFF